ncbi:hypothetical protein ACEPPN_017737 [Leptodophora sp. 'Broadleaf-Isolate-01']
MAAYESQQEAIVAKAQKHGILPEELNQVFERKLELVAAEHGGRSVDWKLGQAEVPGEPFPMAASTALKPEEMKTKPAIAKQDSDGPPSPFPKALHAKSQSTYEEAARRGWVHDRYQPESPKKDSYRLKAETDSYRPIPETDSYRPEPLGKNRPPARPVSGSNRPSTASVNTEGEMKERGPLKTLPNGSSGRVEQRAGLDPFVSSTTSDCGKPYRSLRELIQQKASKADVPMDKIMACFEEKAAIAEKKFVDRSGDWQMYFVEASVWGRFFTGPFPGAEPSKSLAKEQTKSLIPKATSGGTNEAPRSQVKLPSESASPPKRSSLKEYAAGISERLMEDKAIRQDKRREFFQYLQKMRTYSRLEHKGEACDHIRGWFADNLTWQKFFGRELFPFAQPRGKLNFNCAACLMLPKFAPLTSNNMSNVLKTQFANSKPYQVQQVRRTSPVATAPSTPSITNNSGPPIAKPQARDDLNTIVASQGIKGVPTRSITDLNTAPVQSDPVLPISKSSGEAQPTALQQPAAPLSRRSLRTPPPGPPARSASNQVEGLDSHPQSSPPLHLISQLTQMWARDPFLGKGTVVMQNTVPVVHNKTFVGELFNCFASDRKQAIAAVGAELKCHIHYYATSTGDLFLWTEPQIPGDIGSFNRGHVFLTGWVTRIISFGMVKPSVHWNVIRTPFAALQPGPAPTPPENAADAFSRLATYVQAAVSDKPTALAKGDSVSKEKGPLTKVPPLVTKTQTAVSMPVASKPKSEPSTLSDSKTSFKTATDLSLFEDPEEQWQRYKIAFRTSDIDRLMMEETAKNEGDLRMVFDKESEQIISVEELVKRTVYRCSLSGQKGVGVDVGGGGQSAVDTLMGSNKRKADDGDGEEYVRDEKRACV